ncbi:MAG: hypothetical protein ACI91B_001931 [Planctomycetota bacterium]|jgi:hypothetical protein
MSALRWTLAALVLLAALVVVSLSAEPGTWRDTAHWARGFRDTSAARAATCPVLIGKPLSGNPRPTYEKLGQLVMALDASERDQLHAFAVHHSEDSEQALALVAKLPADALNALRQLARMDGKMYAPANLGSRDVALFGDQLVLFDALLAVARYASTEQERIYAWLDVVACGWDLAGAEVPLQTLVGLMEVGRAMEVADDEWLMTLSPDSLRELSEALAKVDAATPVCFDLETVIADLVLLVDEADELQPGDIGLRSIYQSWQNAFSIEDEAIERVSRTVDQVRTFLDATPSSEGWASRSARLQRLVKDDEQCNTDLMASYLNYVFAGELSRRECVANLRLLRMAAGKRLGEDLILPDPLGDGPLGVEDRDDYARFFSAGGIDRRVDRR